LLIGHIYKRSSNIVLLLTV